MGQLKYCDNCLQILLGNLNKEDLYFLNVLIKNKTTSSLFSMSKEKILSISAPDKLNNKNFLNIINRLTACGLIDINSRSHKKKYYINSDGIQLLSIYAKLIKMNL